MFVFGFDLERIMLGLVLFTIVLYVEFWLVTPVASAVNSGSIATAEAQSIPIEKQMQEVFKVVEEQADELIIEKLTLRQARKVAKKLGITQTRTQKIEGEKVKKDKPKDWLIREIKQKVAQNRKLIDTVTKTLKAA